MTSDYINAADALIDKYMQLVRRIAFRILCDSGESDAVARNVLAEACRMPERQNVRILLCSMTVRRCTRILKWRPLKRMVHQHPPVFASSSLDALSPEREFIMRRYWEVYCRASQRLSVSRRAIYVLRELEMMTMDEVGAVTGLPPERIRDGISAARHIVKSELARSVGRKGADYREFMYVMKTVPVLSDDRRFRASVLAGVGSMTSDRGARVKRVLLLSVIVIVLLVLTFVYILDR